MVLAVLLEVTVVPLPNIVAVHLVVLIFKPWSKVSEYIGKIIGISDKNKFF